MTFQIRSAPLLVSTISVVEWCGSATGATPCSGSHLVGSLGNASELSPWPSPSVSAHSVGSSGNASCASGTPSPSRSGGVTYTRRIQSNRVPASRWITFTSTVWVPAASVTTTGSALVSESETRSV